MLKHLDRTAQARPDTAKEDAMLTRLIYASEAIVPLTPDSVQTIVTHARQANTRRHLTGMLVFDHRAFLQVLEGQREVVSEVYGHIAADKRHRRLVLMDVLTVDERSFADWGMGFAPADALGKEQFLRFGGSDIFDPHSMTAAAGLGLLRALSKQVK